MRASARSKTAGDGRRVAEVRERRVAAADAEHGAAARLGVHRRDRGGRRRRVARHGVGDAGGELEPRRRLRREREAHVAVAGQVLRVHQGEAVVAGLLDGRGVARREPRDAGAGGPDLEHGAHS